MKKRPLFSLLVILLFALPACGANTATKPKPTPENPFLEEELAEKAIATARAEKTQIASRVSPYVKVSDGEHRYLAFWFAWNDETVFLPLAEFNDSESGLVSCRLDSDAGLAIGQLFSGLKVVQDECLLDEQAPENAVPIIRIPGYFDAGLGTEGLNILDLHGQYAGNFADIAPFIIENDLLGSGGLILSLHQTDGPNGEPFGKAGVVPTYALPAEALKNTFSSDELANFEGADDVVYAFERKFTWKIPAGYDDLNLSPGNENWFILSIREMKAGNNQEQEYLGSAYIQVMGVGAPENPDN